MENKFRGVYIILVTPFYEDGRIDEESLRSVVDFSIDAGAHGLVVPANVSESCITPALQLCLSKLRVVHDRITLK